MKRKRMRISVFGLGYVGTVCAACLAQRGHSVIGVDRIDTKVDLIRSGRSPVIEREIDRLVATTVQSGHLTATTDAIEAVKSSDMSIVCVGTPGQRNGALGLTAVEAVSTEIGQALHSKVTRHEVVVRSTILPGTTRQVVLPRLVDASGKDPGDAFGVAFNPEFMREGSSVADFNTPSRTIVGALDGGSTDAVLSLFSHLPGVKIATDIETAELAKYVDNTWHALKVAFTNEISVLASTLDIDSREVMSIFSEDNHLNISKAYMRPGFAFGGSCLPKDLRALVFLARTLDLSLPVINHILDSNRMLTDRGFDWILEESKKRVAFLGISFKPGTDDVRESPFVDLVERLSGKGREVRIFDPNVHLAHVIGANKDYLIRLLPHIAELLVPNISDAVAWADTIVVTAADPVYKAAIAKLGSDKVVLDFAQFYRQGRLDQGTLPADTARMSANGMKRTVAPADLMSV
jgi:GDP-mannose 6-dehydrogenase